MYLNTVTAVVESKKTRASAVCTTIKTRPSEGSTRCIRGT